MGPKPLAEPPYWTDVSFRINKIYADRDIGAIKESFGPLRLTVSAQKKTATIALAPTDAQIMKTDREVYTNSSPNYVYLPLCTDFLQYFRVTKIHFIGNSETDGPRFPFGMILRPLGPSPSLPRLKEDGNMQEVRLTRVVFCSSFVDSLRNFRNLSCLYLKRCVFGETLTITNLPNLSVLHLSLVATPQSNAQCIVDVATLPHLEDLMIDTRGRTFQQTTVPSPNITQPYFVNFVSLASIFLLGAENLKLKRMHVLVNWSDLDKVSDLCVFRTIEKFSLSANAREADSFSYIRCAQDMFFDVPFSKDAEGTFFDRVTARTVVSEKTLYTLWAAILKMQPVAVMLGPLVPLILGLCDPSKPLKGAAEVDGSPMEVRERMVKRKSLLKAYENERQPILFMFLTGLERASMEKWLRANSMETRQKKVEAKPVEQKKVETKPAEQKEMFTPWTPAMFQERVRILESDLPQVAEELWLPDTAHSIVCVLNKNFAVDYPATFVK